MSDPVNRSEREERIRQRAYELWEEAGRPTGRQDEFWRAATAEADAEATEPSQDFGPSNTATDKGASA